MPDFCTFFNDKDPSLRVMFFFDEEPSIETCSQVYDGEGLAISMAHGRVTSDP